MWNRKFDPVDFRVEKKGEGFELFTSRMHVTYAGGPFTKNSLNLNAVGGQNAFGAVWYYGEKGDNLGGTARTLDGVDGECQLQEGIMSRSGCSQIDDSHSLVLDENGWTQVRTGDGVDIYVFAYGNDYKEALNDFYRLTGKTPMLPRYALGNWWSRYYAYTEDSYKALVTRFEKEKIPFSVGVLDMDWHLVEEVDPKYGSGWTGYTWNKKYYPDPERFMNWLHDHGMKISVNLHPAGGIRAFEEAYPAMAKELGDVDTEHEAPIDFDITSRKFLEAYFKCVLHPEENKGVDFWWIDWQQGNITKVPGLDPLWMLNHYHYLDNARDGKRPLTFSRYAGPGSHRYPVGFSGDSIVTWESLNFQPYFTSTASNIGYGWWSHDIGGHMLGYRDNELALRWVQLGVFSPINRLHSSKNEFMGKEPWQFPMEIGEVMKEFLRLRHQMLPYLYTMNYRAYKENTPLILPMYYTYPAEQVAYTVKNEYEYGTAFIVAPVTEKSVQGVGRARTHVWLPEGTYIDFFTGLVYSGDREMDMYRDLHSIPVLAKAGAIVPMTEEIFGQEAARNPETMTIRPWRYGGADSGSFRIIYHEDDNESNAYLKDECVLTDMDLNWSTGRFQKAAGRLELIPQKRTWTAARVLGCEGERLPSCGKAIVPMTEEIFGQEAARNPETMTIRVYGGADGSFQLYEDDNESNAYLKDECVLTDMDLKWSTGRFVIHKAAGRLELIPQKRTWTVEFWGVKDTEVTVEVEGTGVEASKKYDEALGCLAVSVPETAATSEIIITLGAPELRENDVKTQVFNLLNQAEIPYMEKVAIMEILDKKISNAAKLTQLTAMHPEEGIVGAVGEILTAIE